MHLICPILSGKLLWLTHFNKYLFQRNLNQFEIYIGYNDFTTKSYCTWIWSLCSLQLLSTAGIPLQSELQFWGIASAPLNLYK